MKHCMECGQELVKKECEHEGMIPYCPTCKEFRFPIFNTAVSMVVLNPNEDKLLMIQQYGKKSNILVAGYVNQTECVEEALRREMKEEIGRSILKYRYLKSEYFEKSNTLICNFAVVIDSESLQEVSAWEVDHAQWYPIEDALVQVKQDSLAQRFVQFFMENYKKNKEGFFL